MSEHKSVKAVQLRSVHQRREALDSFQNVITGYNTSRDKRAMTTLKAGARLAQPQLDEWYAADAIFAKIVDMPPNDMMREGFEVKLGDGDPVKTKQLMKKLRDIGAAEALLWAMKLARLHGGSALLLGANDGLNPEEPLDHERVTSFDYITPLDRWAIYPTSDLYDDPLKPKYGKPRLYQLAAASGERTVNQRVHESRIIRFEGVRLPERLMQRNQGWGDPIGNRLQNAIRNYHLAHDSAATIVHDFTNGVYTFKDLVNLLAQGEEGQAAVLKRLQDLDMSKGIFKALVLDEGETYAKLSTSVQGLRDLVLLANERLTAETDMPHTRLLGESPGASLGQGGVVQDQQWYDYIASQQEAVLRDPVETIVELALRSKDGPTGGRVPPEWSVEFKPLWQLDDKTMAEIRYMQSQTDEKYHGMNVLDQDEIRDSRFGGDGWSGETTLDEEARNLLREATNEERDQAASAVAPEASEGERPEAPQEGKPTEEAGLSEKH